jgi:uncharacterized protein (TIRG00374 family)
MKKRLLYILQYLIFMGGGLFLVWWQLRSMTEAEKTEFYAAFQHARYGYVLPIVLMALASHLSRSMRWKLLMEPLQYKPKLSNVLSVTMVGYLANAAVPRLGEILKCSFLARYEKLKVDKLIGTIILERVFDMICYVVFIAITVLIQIDVIGAYVEAKLETITQSTGWPLWAKGLLVLGILILCWLFIRWLFRRFPENGLVSRINHFVRGISEGLSTIRHLKKRRAFLVHTLFIWAMYLLQIYLGFKAFDGTDHLSIKAAFSVLTLATLAMIATPGGIGSFPIFVMQTLLIYGIDGPLGKAFGWMMWGVATGIVIVSGVVALLILPYINKAHEKRSIHTGENT